MNKKLTDAQIRQIASDNGLEFAMLKAVVEVEAGGSGFILDEKSKALVPKILFEPHVFYRLLGNKKLIGIRNDCMAKQPKLCYAKWGTYPYGKTHEQHGRLAVASTFHRETALESCSWGMGQVMGHHWQSLGYASLQDFINAMYQDEMSQIDCMVRFIKKNGLLPKLQKKDWKGFAKGYNGAGYAKNAYDVKLANAYRQYA